MTDTRSTCWTVIRGAATGSPHDLESFVARYSPIIGDYLDARWRGGPIASFRDDAIQEVFVECFREGGVLDRVEAERTGSFHAFLYGVVRNVALRFETRTAKPNELQAGSSFDPSDQRSLDERCSVVFDRSWAESIVREAVSRQADRAKILGGRADKRVELLKLRFYDGLPIREIAGRWGDEAKVLYREIATAREEFEDSLREVISLHFPGDPRSTDREIERLLEILDR